MSIPTHSFGHLPSKGENTNTNNNNTTELSTTSTIKNNTNANSKNNTNNNNQKKNRRDGVLLKNCGTSLAEENDEGSVEYKWRLVGITDQRLEHLITQMKFRVAEGRGECIYEIGVEDDGYTRGLPQVEFDESIATLRTMASRLGFTLTLNCVISKTNPKDPSQVLKCAEVRVRKIVQTLPTCRIAVTGDTNSGKSTLVGVVAAGELDDGGGTVRQRVFNHKHELQSGQTSSVCDRIVGFSAEGGIVNYNTNENNNNNNNDAMMYGGDNRNNNSNNDDNAQQKNSGGNAGGDTDAITERAATLTLLMDLPGHLKRSHTALSALVGRFPHVVCLVINPNDLSSASTTTAASPNVATPVTMNNSENSVGGPVGNASFGASATATTTTRTNISSHIAQCAALQLPFFIVFTHQDSTPPLVLGQAAAQVDRAIGEETGKRLVMVSAPIFPGEVAGGGFSGREMIHASSDMFLSDLGSACDNTPAVPKNQKNGAAKNQFVSSPVNTPNPKNNKKKSGASPAGSFDPFYSSWGGDTDKDEQDGNNNNNNNDDDASSFLKSDLGTNSVTSPQKNKRSNNNNNKDDDQYSSASGRAAGNNNNNNRNNNRNPVETYLEKNVPVFIVSCVSGYGIQFFKHFLHQLSLTPPRLTLDECEEQEVYVVSNKNNGVADADDETSATKQFEDESYFSSFDQNNENDDDGDDEDENNHRNLLDDEDDEENENDFDNPSQMLISSNDGSSNTVDNSTNNLTSASQQVTSGDEHTGSFDEENQKKTEKKNISSEIPKKKQKSNNNNNNKVMRHIPTVRFVVDRVYSVARVGLVAAGTVTSGTIQVGQHLFWGPSKHGTFFPVQVGSLHYQRNFVRSVGSGNECAVAFEGGDFGESPEILAMSSRRGLLLYGNGHKDALPPATSRDFRVLLAKAHAVTLAQCDFKVDMELTAFVFSAKQSVFLKSIDPVDFSSEEYAAVRGQRAVGDASRPLILQCSFVYQPEVLAVGAPIVLLRNTPDGRLGACVAGRIVSFVACERTHHHHHHHHHHHSHAEKGPSALAGGSGNKEQGEPSATVSGGDSSSRIDSASHQSLTSLNDDDSPITKTGNNSTKKEKKLQKKLQRNLSSSQRSSSSQQSGESTCSRQTTPTTKHQPNYQDPNNNNNNNNSNNSYGQFPASASNNNNNNNIGNSDSSLNAGNNSINDMKKPQTSSPPLTPTTSPPLQHQQHQALLLHQQQLQLLQQQSNIPNALQSPVANDAADLEVAKERAERKKVKQIQKDQQ